MMEYNGRGHVNGKPAQLIVNNSSIMVEYTPDDIWGVDRANVRAIKALDDGKVVIAHSEAGVIKSFTVIPEENPLVFFDAMAVIPPKQVVLSEFDRLYEHFRSNLEPALNKILATDKPEPADNVDIEPIIEVLDRFPGGRNYLSTRIWDIMTAPEDYQLAWAKVSYLIYLRSWIRILTDNEMVYSDENRMWPADWVAFFKHVGITPIESPKILEMAKLGSVHLNIYPLRDPDELPKDYNKWFKQAKNHQNPKPIEN